MSIDAKKATPNPLITKPSPIKDWASINVIALIIKINNPNVTIVIGMVKMIRIGLTIMFNIDKITLAINAVLKSAK